jgi:hypothetical protein
MKRNSLVLTALLLTGGAAMAADVVVLEKIQVRPVHGDMIEFACDTQYTPKPIDVESLLQIHDRTQTQQLTNKLMGAVGQACAAGIADIVVERGKAGSSVIWYPVGYDPVVSGPYVVPTTTTTVVVPTDD